MGVDSLLRSDNRAVKLVITEDGVDVADTLLETEDFGVFLQEAGKLRAKMLPVVPRKLEPNPTFRDVTRETVFHVNRQHVVSQEIFIAARHEGFGWLAFTLSNESALILANLLLKEAQANTPKIIKPNSGLIV